LDDVHFLFKSAPAPFGRRSHGHNPQNAFELQGYGDILLQDITYMGSFHSPIHMYVYETKAHNTVLVNGEGQIEAGGGAIGADAVGSIVAESFNKDFDYVVGDATPAYAGKLKRFRRHVAFVKPELFVIWDELAAPQPATFQFRLHALAEFTFDPNSLHFGVQREHAGFDAQYLSPVPMTLIQTSGYGNIKMPTSIPKLLGPEKDGPVPNQWHLEATNTEKRESLDVLTVIKVHKGQERVEWTAKRLESPSAIGAKVTIGGKTTLVAFKKSGQQRGSLEGIDFSESAITKRL
jgi:hypothetical protein